MLYVFNRAVAVAHRYPVVRLDCTIHSLSDGHTLCQWKVQQGGEVEVDTHHCRPTLVVGGVAACRPAVQPLGRGMHQTGEVAWCQAV